MGFWSTVKKIRVPAPSELADIPGQIRTTTQNQKLNEINIRYFDRFFKKCISVKGIKDHKTSIPIVYFETPQPLACIIFDDSEYLNERNELTIDICEDYPYALNWNSELVIHLNQQYYNDFIENKVPEKKEGVEGWKVYKIPVLLNRVPREVIRVHPDEGILRSTKPEDIQRKSEITQYLIRQIGKLKFLERVGKEDNHDLITGVLIGAPIFILVGIFISFAFLVN